jgi:heme-degrading monooxygenase HmoA
MILEHALLPVIPGREDEFEASMRLALPIISSAPQCHGAEVRGQLEDGSTYLLLVRWESLEAHMAFRETELFQQWKALTHHFYSTPAKVTHFYEPVGA